MSLRDMKPAEAGAALNTRIKAAVALVPMQRRQSIHHLGDSMGIDFPGQR